MQRRVSMLIQTRASACVYWQANFEASPKRPKQTQAQTQTQTHAHLSKLSHPANELHKIPPPTAVNGIQMAQTLALNNVARPSLLSMVCKFCHSNWFCQWLGPSTCAIRLVFWFCYRASVQCFAPRPKCSSQPNCKPIRKHTPTLGSSEARKL